MLLVALVIGGVFVLSLVWWKVVAPTLPPMNPDDAEPGQAPAYMAEHFDEPPLNPAAPGQPDLFEVRKPISQSTVYPGLRLGMSLDEIKSSLKGKGLRFLDHPRSERNAPEIEFRVDGRMLGMDQDAPIQAVGIARDGADVFYLAFSTEFVPSPESEATFGLWATRVRAVLGPPTSDNAGENKARGEDSHYMVWTDGEYELVVAHHRIQSNQKGEAELFISRAGDGQGQPMPALAGK